MVEIDPSRDLHIHRSKSPYRQRIDQEGLPVYTGYYIEDLRALEVKPLDFRDFPGGIFRWRQPPYPAEVERVWLYPLEWDNPSAATHLSPRDEQQL